MQYPNYELVIVATVVVGEVVDVVVVVVVVGALGFTRHFFNGLRWQDIISFEQHGL